MGEEVEQVEGGIGRACGRGEYGRRGGADRRGYG